MKSYKEVLPSGIVQYRNKDGKLHREDGPARIWVNGTEDYWLNGKLHREDGPAVIHPDGLKAWYINGELHREDGPAVIWADGTEDYWLKDILYSYEEWLELTGKEKEMKVTKKVYLNGIIGYHNKDGLWHREDGPAYISPNGDEEYYLNGERYSYEEWLKITGKEKEMKVTKKVLPNGNIEYTNEHGYLHREDGPAVIWANGYKAWFINGSFHREDGPAVIWPDGTEYYCLKGKRYSYEEWLKLTGKEKEMKVTKEVLPSGNIVYKNEHGEFHREDGPAVIYPDGDELYFLKGKRYSYEEWLKLTGKEKETTYDEGILNVLIKNNIDFTVKDGKVIIDIIKD